MNKFLILIVTTSLIYLLIASVLIFIPVQRNQPQSNLDFNVLDLNRILADGLKEKNFTARDNKEIFYRYLHGNSDVTLVLLHGSGSDGRYLLPLAAELNSSLNITVVIPDLRGHGESALSAPGDISYLGQFSHDLEDLNHHLKSLNPETRIILGGHSSGGGLAVKYGGSSLTTFDGYILLAPYLGYQAPTVRPNSGGWVQVAKLRYAGLAMLNNVGLTFLNHKQVLYFNRPTEMSDALQVDSYSYRLNESFSPQSYASDLQNNKNPMLLLVGENDEAFYPDLFQEVLDNTAPHAEFHIIQNVKHLDLPSNQETATLIINWIEKSYNKLSKRDALSGAPS